MSVEVEAEVRTPAEQPGSASGYRYPGSPPFQDTPLDRKLFWGRAKEADTVLHSILSSNLFLLYAVSGLGKSSLLNAGVAHRLRERGHWPVSVRLNDPSRPLVTAIREQIEAAVRADPSIELVRDPSTGGAVDDSRLWNMLAPLEVWKRNDLQQLVVILDQFEELFTLGWDRAERQKLIAQFGEVVRGFRLDGGPDGGEDGAGTTVPPRVRFVIVIREDSLGELEALATDVPQILQNRFRLGPLDLKQAGAAIREPAMLEDERLGSQRFAYTEAASHVILDFLGTRTLRGTVVHADAVDPSQLQIVCQYIERAIVPSKKPTAPGKPVEIDDGDLGGRAGLDRILGHFYERTLQTFPASNQRAVRNLCEKGLINKSRRRLSLEEDEIGNTYGVSSATLDQLVAERLLRAEPRLDSVYFELSHDTLIEPILNYRDEQLARTARRRRRWIVGGAATVGALAVGGLLFYAVRSGEDARVLAVGDELSGSVAGGGSGTLFALQVPADQVTQLTITPESGVDDLVDVAVELRSPTGTTRQQDRSGPGQPERMVVSPAPDVNGTATVRVTSTNSASGSFTIVAEALDATDLTGVEQSAGRIAEPGGLAVYQVMGGGRAPPVIVVTPTTSDSQSPAGTAASQSQKESKQPKDLDVDIEIIDPSGNGTRIDSAEAGGPERFSVAGPVGSYLVVVRGYLSSAGAFSIDLSQASGTLVPGEAQSAEVTSRHSVTFGFDLAGSDAYIAHVIPGEGLDAVLEVQGPEGAAVQNVDVGGSGEEEAGVLAGTEGYYSLSVSGYEGSSGTFEIEVTQIHLTPLAVGQSVSAAETTVFEIALQPEQFVELRVEPTSDDDGRVDLEVLDQDGSVIDERLTPDGGGPVTVSLDGALVSAYRVIVRGQGEYTASVTALRVQPLVVGDSTASAGNSVFDLTVETPATLAVVVAPSGGFNPVVQVGGPSDFAADADAGGSRVAETVLIRDAVPGPYRIVVTGSESSTDDFTISVTDAEPVSLDVGEEAQGDLRAPGQVGLYEVDVSGDRALNFVVTPGGGWDAVLSVTDSVGGSFEASSAGLGLAESVVIAAPESAAYEVLVTRGTSAGGRFSLSVAEPAGGDVTVGSSTEVHLAAPTDIGVFGLDVSEGATVKVLAVPSAGLNVSIALTSPSGFAERADDAPEGGAESLVISQAEAGLYQMVIAGDGSASGDVELSVTAPETANLGVGQTAPGSISNPVRFYSVQAAGGGALKVVVTPSGGLDAVLQATGPSGATGPVNVAGADGTEVLVVPAEGAGTYQIQVASANSSTGDFEISVAALQPVAVAVGATTHATLDAPGDGAVFRVDVPAGVPVTVAVTPSGGLDAVVQVSGPRGVIAILDELLANGAATLEIPAGEAEAYQILVSGYGSSTGGLELTVTRR